jgi:hypothetical protein
LWHITTSATSFLFFSKKGNLPLQNGSQAFLKFGGGFNSALSMYEAGLTLVRVRTQISIITSTSEVTKGGLIISASAAVKSNTYFTF